MQTANEILRDKAISHEVYLNRYYSGVTRRVMELLRETEQDLIRQLKTLEFENSMTVAQIDARLKSVQAIISEGYQLAGRDLLEELKQAAEYEQDWQQKTITDALPIQFDMVAVAPVTLFAAIESKPFEGKLLKEWIDKLDADSFQSIQSAVRMGLVEGLSYSDITKRIIGTKPLQYSDGVMALNRRKTQALVSTAVAHATNTARNEFYQANDDLIKQVQVVATLDARTSMGCKARDGKVYPLENYPKPPYHIRCRTTVVGIIKSWKELGLKNPPEGTRASMDGQVSEALNYNDWLKTKPEQFQNDVLGIERAKLFRGGINLDRFVDDSGRTLTLDELKKIKH